MMRHGWFNKNGNHRIGLWDNSQESPIFDGKNYGFRLKLSLKPIQWGKLSPESLYIYGMGSFEPLHRIKILRFDDLPSHLPSISWLPKISHNLHPPYLEVSNPWGVTPSPHPFIKFIDGFSMIFPYKSCILGYPPDYGNHETPHKWPNPKRFGFLHGYR